MIARLPQCLRVAVSCVWLALVSACADRAAARDACAAEAPRFSTRDSAGVAISISRAAAALHIIADADELWRAGETETDSVLFGEVTDATRLVDGRVLVADGRSVALQLFDSSGRWAGEVGDKGSGPGQYSRVSALLRTSGDSVLVYDGRTGNLTTLDAQLSPVSVRRVSPSSRRPTDSAAVYLLGAVPKGVLHGRDVLVSRLVATRVRAEVTNVSRDSLVLQRESAANSLSDSLTFVMGQQRFEYFANNGDLTFGDVPLGYVESIAVGAGGFFVGDAYTFNVAHFSPAGTLERFIRVCHKPALLDEREIDRTINEMLTEVSSSSRAMEEPGLRQLPRARFTPAHLELLTDTSGQLWAREFTYAGAAQRWRVFDQAGQWQRTVELPDNADLLEVGDGYALVRYSAPLGVESVRLYRYAPG